MTRSQWRRSRIALGGILVGNLLVLCLAANDVRAHPGFHGGGGHFNVGPHFAGPRPHPASHRHAGPHPPPRDHHPHHHEDHRDHHRYPPHYWPGGYWAGVATGAAIGAVVYSLPPACTATVVNGVTYERCNGVWYRPSYSGNQVVYVVVDAPR